jgi:hypothetical protein
MEPGGWQSDDKNFAEHLTTAFPPPDTAAGYPWVAAYWEAVNALGATVVQEPEADAPDPNVVY